MNAMEALGTCGNASLRKATRRVGQLFDDAMRAGGLRATQQHLLAQVSAMQAPTMKKLASALVMDLSALGHTLQPLLRDGYVPLSVNKDDRRSKLVMITDLGRLKLESSTVLWRDAHSRFEAALGKERAEQLLEILDAVASPSFSTAFRNFEVLRNAEKSQRGVETASRPRRSRPALQASIARPPK
ncbi:MarR family winged helix-turn-helix transcriptional regulator [Beijerinckia sp. L45]|uniref:MarR family winged helix-turn-helix transcriptional regulator n=1 Tax=Beijerinckia sp. L45 TaxID=1641855 RepID=UPI00131E8370|nr:MarR family winged helix-turn-helix transcriptional regulator [Beijerinckia sp. L45]